MFVCVLLSWCRISRCLLPLLFASISPFTPASLQPPGETLCSIVSPGHAGTLRSRSAAITCDYSLWGPSGSGWEPAGSRRSNSTVWRGRQGGHSSYVTVQLEGLVNFCPSALRADFNIKNELHAWTGRDF